ncbi:unnamed protein product [Meloidogyne enterolobii]|uniref:Uncharacterized protein n=1 Tax=Meloidogyne enterolobii TaxID=390850 RepID=A0ACB0ZA02_MELEN
MAEIALELPFFEYNKVAQNLIASKQPSQKNTKKNFFQCFFHNPIDYISIDFYFFSFFIASSLHTYFLIFPSPFPSPLPSPQFTHTRIVSLSSLIYFFFPQFFFLTYLFALKKIQTSPRLSGTFDSFCLDK